jgi:hypothetical protein
MSPSFILRHSSQKYKLRHKVHLSTAQMTGHAIIIAVRTANLSRYVFENKHRQVPEENRYVLNVA